MFIDFNSHHQIATNIIQFLCKHYAQLHMLPAVQVTVKYVHQWY